MKGMATLDDLDQALATAKTARNAAQTALGTAKGAWWGAVIQLGLAQPNRGGGPQGRIFPVPPVPNPPATTAQLQGLADALLAAQAAFTSADAAVTAAQAAFDAASKAAQVQ